MPWDRLKRRRIEAAIDSDGPGVHVPIGATSVSICVSAANVVAESHNCIRTKAAQYVFEKALEILKLLLQNEADVFSIESPDLRPELAKGSPFSNFVTINPCPNVSLVARTLVDGGVDLSVAKISTIGGIVIKNHLGVFQILIDHDLPVLNLLEVKFAALASSSVEIFEMITGRAQPGVMADICGDEDFIAEILPVQARPDVIQYIRDYPTNKLKLATAAVLDNLLEEECAICYEKYTKNEKVTTLPCGHVYHDHCMQQVLEYIKFTLN